MNKSDVSYMQQVLELGEQVKGRTGDNPWVGCVIVKESKILGRGTTHPHGGPHAEAAALSEVCRTGQSLNGATLYCSVEPCSFEGRTPSCSKAISSTGIIRVVAAIRDPHPRVNGEGFRILREAGIEVCEGVCAEAARGYLESWLARFI